MRRKFTGAETELVGRITSDCPVRHLISTGVSYGDGAAHAFRYLRGLLGVN